MIEKPNFLILLKLKLITLMYTRAKASIKLIVNLG
jgi:hypothetical protein